jgi:hypothetical protein
MTRFNFLLALLSPLAAFFGYKKKEKLVIISDDDPILRQAAMNLGYRVEPIGPCKVKVLF